MVLSSKKAEAFCRARGNCLDPTPRNPYHPITRWKCKLCEKREQSTKHYVVECKGLDEILKNKDRNWIYEKIKTLEVDEEQIEEIGRALAKIYIKLNENE